MLEERLKSWISEHRPLMADLQRVREMDLPQCYIAAGYIRNYAWDILHGYDRSDRHSDIDVVFFDPDDTSVERDELLEWRLREETHNSKWSVKNQARMHIKNGDGPYQSTADAMSMWPETATAIGARLSPAGEIELICPYGLEDLFALRVRRCPAFLKREYYLERVQRKQWAIQWPLLTIFED